MECHNKDISDRGCPIDKKVKRNACYRYQEDLEESGNAVVDFKSLFGKTFLITGASGLIASFLVDLLFYANEAMDADIEVYALVRDRAAAEKRYKGICGNPAFHLLVQDVCDPIILEKRVDYTIHAAGDGYPKAFLEHPVETMLPALLGTYRLLEYMKAVRGSRFLYVSSGEIYGVGGDCEFVESDSHYVDTMKSRSCYPSAKRAAETMCASYFAEYGTDIVVARPGHVYGPFVSGKDNRASVQFFQNILNGQDVILKSEGKQLRSYTYVADCVSALLTILSCGVPGEAYNIANPEARATIAEFAKMAAAAAGKDCRLAEAREQDLKEGSPVSCAVLNSGKLQDLGWKGSFSVPRGIRHTLEILREYAENGERWMDGL